MRNSGKLLAMSLALSLTLGVFAPGARAASTSYTDVSATASYAEAVDRLTKEGILSGMGNGKFGPEVTVTRAQVVSVLGRLAKASPAETDRFTDVTPNSYYSGYVGWAAENGIIQGDGKGHFLPDEQVTSEHLNIMLTRYADSVKKSITFYNTGAPVVTRADLAQRLYQFFVEQKPGDKTNTVYVERVVEVEKKPEPTVASTPAVVQLSGGGAYGFGAAYLMGYEDNGIYTFKNIPYGTAARFKRSAPMGSYGSAAAPKVALNNGSVSPQQNTLTEYVNWAAAAAFMTPSDSDMFSIEDQCLNLNVWTKSTNEAANKPVLVFMHGGGTENGSAIELKMYEGSYFADYADVVFVSVNARLNYLGYLDLTAIGGDANLGLGDMVLSLEWVKDNIAKFGGNPDNVTIIGQSGGGTKVGALASSPKAQTENLFQKVVISSGFGARAKTAEEQATNAGKVVTATKASDDFANWLRSAKDGETIGGVVIGASKTWTELKTAAAAAADADVFAYLQQLDYNALYALCGKRSAGIKTGMTADGTYFDLSGNLTGEGGLNNTARNYTYLIGSNWAEMGGKNSADAVLGLSWDGTGNPSAAMSNLSEEQKKSAMVTYLSTRVGRYDETKAAFEAAYPGHEFYELRSLGTTDFNYTTYKKMAELVSGGNKVYNYFGTYTMPYFGGMTMIHTADLAYFFHSIETSPYMIHGDEANAWKVADTMATSLANFCRTGDPSVAGSLSAQTMAADQAHTIIYDVESRCVTPDFNAALRALITEK